MSCEKYEKLISLYIEKELDEGDEKDLMLHLDSCESCRQQLEAIRCMQEMFRQDDRPLEPINKMRNKIYARIYRDLLIMFVGLVIIISVVSISGGLAQMYLLGQTPFGVRIFFFMGILLLIVGLTILIYDIFVDIFKIIIKK
jgi:predicted anti-sigma-YlaC factor YlaD